MLARFNVIVAIDSEYGIGKNGSIPWRNREDMLRFRTLTIGNGNNAVIMGRKTYESLPPNMRPLPDRYNVVVASNDIEGVTTVRSLKDALQACADRYETFVIGGQRLYEEAIRKYSYLCNQIFITHIEGTHDCDVFFPYKEIEGLGSSLRECINDLRTETIRVKIIHPEYSYLNLLGRISGEGETRDDRTGTGTRSLFGVTMKFDLRKGFPLLTTKKMWFNGVVKELLFFISGKTDTKILEAQGVNIWKANTTEQYLRSHNLSWQEGNMGPMYPHQWRHAGANYMGCNIDYTDQGVDQLANVIYSIKQDPFSRRHIISAWNVADIDSMALPPCHCMVQFYVGCDDDKIPKYLDACLYQRSGDMFLGVPFNIASYALLLSIIAHLTGLTPRIFTHHIGDAHIYLNHLTQVEEQLKRTPLPLSKITFSDNIDSIDSLRFEDIILEDYQSWPNIKGDMSV